MFVYFYALMNVWKFFQDLFGIVATISYLAAGVIFGLQYTPLSDGDIIRHRNAVLRQSSFSL